MMAETNPTTSIAYVTGITSTIGLLEKYHLLSSGASVADVLHRLSSVGVASSDVAPLAATVEFYFNRRKLLPNHQLRHHGRRAFICSGCPSYHIIFLVSHTKQRSMTFRFFLMARVLVLMMPDVLSYPKYLPENVWSIYPNLSDLAYLDWKKGRVFRKNLPTLI